MTQLKKAKNEKQKDVIINKYEITNNIHNGDKIEGNQINNYGDEINKTYNCLTSWKVKISSIFSFLLLPCS